MRGLDGGHVYCLKLEDGVYMLVREIVVFYHAKVVYGGEIEVSAFCAVEDGLALHSCKELAVLVEELEGIPLAGIVAGGDDDAAVCLAESDGELRRGCAGKTAAHYVYAAGYEGAYHEVLHHLSAEAGVTAYDHLVAVSERLLALLEAFAVSIGELNDVYGGEIVPGGASDSATDAGN